MKEIGCYVLVLVSSLCIGPSFPEITIDNWSYTGAGDTNETYWKDISGSFCGDSSQSPINVDTSQVEELTLAPFNIDSYNIIMNATLENNGHSLEVETKGSDDGGYYDVTGGGLSGTFRAVQFHFHFGSDSTQGSEHTIDNQQYPAEMHIVHYNTMYPSATEAKENKGGIAVLGFFLQEDDDGNSALDIILNEVHNIRNAEEHHTIQNLRLADLVPSSLDNYWRYEGSLTTPLCNKVVTWSLFKDTIKISADQLDIMRTLMSDAVNEGGDHLSMSNNYRSIQSIGSRTVYTVTAHAGQLNQSKIFVLSSIFIAIFLNSM